LYGIYSHLLISVPNHKHSFY